MVLQVIREDVLSAIQKSVHHFVKETNVRCGLVADKTGLLITQVGFTASLDLRSLAALVSGIFVSGEDLAKLLGESHFVVLYHEGKKMSIFFSLVASDYIFVAIFDDRTNMGVVQLYSKQINEQLTPILTAKEAAQTASASAEPAALRARPGERLLDDDELEAFFGQGTDRDADGFGLDDGTDSAADAPVELVEEQDWQEGEADGSQPPAEAEGAEEPIVELDNLQDGLRSEAETSESDSLDALFGGGESSDAAEGDELSRLFDGIAIAEDAPPPRKAPADRKSPKEGKDELEDLFQF